MTTITVDNKEYEFESLSEETRAQFVSLQFTDQEIAQLQARLAAMQTARNAYAQALSNLLAEKDTVVQ
jgi:DNA repair ATPase RecN